MVPEIRIRALNHRPVREKDEYVVYWMIAYRRLHENFALERAVEWARQLERPLVILEPLRCDYLWASDRLHAFVMHGMADHAARAPNLPISYYPYVEPEIGAGRGFLAELAGQACAVVTDDYPAFFYPRMLRAAARILPIWSSICTTFAKWDCRRILQ